MTIMPDLVAKTRIFKAVETMFNNESTSTLVTWQDILCNKPLVEAIDILRDGGHYNLNAADYTHLKEHVFNYPNGSGEREGWWGPDIEAIAGEGFCHLLEHLIYDKPYDPKKRERKKPRKVDAWWLCPVTYYFRVLILRNEYNDDWVTFQVVTPPKDDHPKHFAEYNERKKNKVREKHGKMPANYGSQAEPIWVTSHIDDSVKEGKDKNDSPVKLANVVTSFKSSAHVETVHLLAEPY